ncbi:hypothetical protein MASR1M66_16160 [Aminivibrio sp.]
MPPSVPDDDLSGEEEGVSEEVPGGFRVSVGYGIADVPASDLDPVDGEGLDL